MQAVWPNARAEDWTGTQESQAVGPSAGDGTVGLSKSLLQPN